VNLSEGKYIDVDLAAGKRFAANFLDAIPNCILRMSRSDVGCMMWVVGTATISSLHKWATLAISNARTIELQFVSMFAVSSEEH
jgi:hypothetical protein